MPHRGSLKSCVEHAIERLKLGQSHYVIITANAAGKYYTLFHPSEYESRLLNKPDNQDHIVLCCTGGELASMIGTAQMKLDLTEH
jgi:hypothetical protein